MPIINALIEKYNNRKKARMQKRQQEDLNRPQFMIKNLYIAYDVSVPLNGNNPNQYLVISNFAICRLCPCCNEYRVINDKNLPNNYVVRYAIPFCAEMQGYMQDRNLNITSMLSLKQLQEIENTHSEQLFIKFN